MTDERQTGEEVVVLREIWNELKSVHSSLNRDQFRHRIERLEEHAGLLPPEP